MAWTRFMDMHSGGRQKEDFSLCFIEAPEAEAKVIFYNRFGHSPDRITCTCCGEDYSVNAEKATLAQSSGYDRNCKWDSKKKWYVKATSKEHLTVAEFRKRDNVCIVKKADIKDEERIGEVPQEGYVWM